MCIQQNLCITKHSLEECISPTALHTIALNRFDPIFTNDEAVWLLYWSNHVGNNFTQYLQITFDLVLFVVNNSEGHSSANPLKAC